MGEFPPNCPSGTVSFCLAKPPVYWNSFTGYLGTEEARDDYAKFRSSIVDAYSSLALSTISENQVSIGWYLFVELNKLQRHNFSAYLLSSGHVRHDCDGFPTLRDLKVAVQGLSLPHGSFAESQLTDYRDHLSELLHIHKYFAYQKELAKCDFIKWDSDFDETVQRLKSEKKWVVLSDGNLRGVLAEHFSLLRQLKNKFSMDLVTVGNKPERIKLLAAIDVKYSESIVYWTKKFEERRREKYFDHMEFRNLLHRRIDQAEASRTACIPKGCPSTTQKLFLLNDRALVAESYARTYFQYLQYLREKLSRLARAGGKNRGPPTGFVPGLLSIVAISAALGAATLGAGKKARR